MLDEHAPAAVQLPDAPPECAQRPRSAELVIAINAEQVDGLRRGGRLLAFNLESLAVANEGRLTTYVVQSAVVATDHTTKERQLLLCLAPK